MTSLIVRLNAMAIVLLLLAACSSPAEDAPDEPGATITETDPSTVAPGATDGSPAPPGDWCNGHGLPESMCTKCNPELTAGFKERGDWCAEHELPESACPVCNPQAPPSAVSAEFGGQTIRFKDAAHEEVVGIETSPARAADVARTLDVTGKIAFDHDRLADVRSMVPGLVRAVESELGAFVEADQVVFVLESAEVGAAQGDATAARQQVKTARAHRDRQRMLFENGTTSKRQLELAEQDLVRAKSALSGVTRGLSVAGASGGTTLEIKAPIAGFLIERPGVLGTLATTETSLATVADTTVMWAMLDVPEDDASAVRVGQRVRVRVDGLSGERYTSEVDWIAPLVDPRTRTVAVRARLDNPDGLLRANQFARAQIEVGAPRDALLVPRAAVQRVGEESVVFVRTTNGVFEPRAVQIVHRTEHDLAVEGDLHAGDAVVTTGGFILKTEMSPESIGAGCCEVD